MSRSCTSLPDHVLLACRRSITQKSFACFSAPVPPLTLIWPSYGLICFCEPFFGVPLVCLKGTPTGNLCYSLPAVCLTHPSGTSSKKPPRRKPLAKCPAGFPPASWRAAPDVACAFAGNRRPYIHNTYIYICSHIHGWFSKRNPCPFGFPSNTNPNGVRRFEKLPCAKVSFFSTRFGVSEKVNTPILGVPIPCEQNPCAFLYGPSQWLPQSESFS